MLYLDSLPKVSILSPENFYTPLRMGGLKEVGVPRVGDVVVSIPSSTIDNTIGRHCFDTEVKTIE